MKPRRGFLGALLAIPAALTGAVIGRHEAAAQTPAVAIQWWYGPPRETIDLHVSVPDPAAAGARIVESIQAWERQTGKKVLS
jgi:hypothetical protein